MKVYGMATLILAVFLGFGEFASSGEIGLGAMLGGPTGVSGNLFLTDDRSIDFGLGVGLGARSFHLHSTYLFHSPKDITLDNYSFGWYFGGGARLANRRSDNDDDKTLFGPRGSAGLNFPLTTNSGHQFDLFVEAALNLSLVSEVSSDFDAAVGGRYYF